MNTNLTILNDSVRIKEGAKMTKMEIKEIRELIKFDMRSLSLCVGIPLSTYQRYENGTAAIPEQLADKILEIRAINLTFTAGMAARIDERIDREWE